MMAPIDLGALVVIAARALEEEVPAVLDRLDVAAAEAALAEAALAEAALAEAETAGAGSAPAEATGPGSDVTGTRPDATGTGPGVPGSDPEARAAACAAACAAALLGALLRHRPLARGNEQAAVLTTVTFLAVNGWQVDLEPPGDTAAVVAHLSAGRWSDADLAAWLSPRISGYHPALTSSEAPAKPGKPAKPGRPAKPAKPVNEAMEANEAKPAKEEPMHGWLPSLRRTARRKGGDNVFRRFSPQAREVIISAQQEARALHHNFIGTEHILLGLLRDREGLAGRALHMLGISPETVREQVLDIIGEGKQEPAGHIPLTPRTKRVLQLAVQEAAKLGHLYVGTEHILLSLLRVGDGVGWHVLTRLGLTVPKVRNQVFELMNQDRRTPAEVISPPGIRDYDTRIDLARQAKNAAIDAQDFDRAATARETEKELLVERDRLIARWSSGVDVATLGRELDWLRDEVSRLQRLLLHHGIEPDQPLQNPGGPAQQSA